MPATVLIYSIGIYYFAVVAFVGYYFIPYSFISDGEFGFLLGRESQYGRYSGAAVMATLAILAVANLLLLQVIKSRQAYIARYGVDIFLYNKKIRTNYKYWIVSISMVLLYCLILLLVAYAVGVMGFFDWV